MSATNGTPAAPPAPAPVQTPGRPVAPTPPATAPPAAPDTAGELAKLEQARRAIELKERAHVVQVRKFSEERKTLGEKLSEYESYKKEKAQAKVNPAAAAKALWGEKWFEVLSETQIHGVPPAQLIASEIAAAEERVEQRFAKRDEESQRQAAEQRRQAEAGARQQLNHETTEFVKSNLKDYPVFKAKMFGGEDRVGALLALRIESEYKRTERRDPATGQVVSPGRILTTKEAADLLESDLLGLAEEAAAHEKYQPKLREKLQPPKPPPPAPGGLPQQRRTLSNDLTGSTPSGAPQQLTADERRDRAIAARNAAVAAKVRP